MTKETVIASSTTQPTQPKNNKLLTTSFGGSTLFVQNSPIMQKSTAITIAGADNSSKKKNKKNKKSVDMLEGVDIKKPIISTRKSTSKWFSSSGLHFEENLFKYGIIAFTTNKKPSYERRATSGTFIAKDRKFVVCELSHGTKTANQGKIKVIQPDILIPDNLTVKEKERAHDFYPRAKKTYELLNNLTNGAGISAFENSTFIINANRIEEVFYPVDLNNDSAVYLYPWISKYNKTHKALPAGFSGFDSFVSATCMLGYGLRGYMNDIVLPLIKHDNIYPIGQYFDDIEADDVEDSPYDQMVFSELDTLASTIVKFSKRTLLADKTRDINLLLHLPYCDYILFCVDLYVRGKMSLRALDKVIKEIYSRKNIYFQKIKEICGKHNIKVSIESPFQSLFNQLNIDQLIEEQENAFDDFESSFNNFDIAEKMLKSFGLIADEMHYRNLNADEQKVTIRGFIKGCLEKLKDPKINSGCYQIWCDYVELQEIKFKKKSDRNSHQLEEIDSFECLFHMANAMMLALASKKNNALDTCSLLSTSEKQIQRTYADYVDTDPKKRYMPVVNILIQDSCFAFSLKHELLFYFNSPNSGNLAKLFREKLLVFAHQNALSKIRNAQGQRITEEQHDIQAILAKPEPTIYNLPSRKSPHSPTLSFIDDTKSLAPHFPLQTEKDDMSNGKSVLRQLNFGEDNFHIAMVCNGP